MDHIDRKHFDSARLTYPDIIALINQRKREASLFLCQTNPNLAVHHEAVVQVDHLFLDTTLPGIYLSVFLSLSPTQAVETQEVAISGLNNVFLGVIAEQGAQIDKILGLSDG